MLQSPVSNLSTAKTRCDGLTLSTGRDHAARHTCFIVNNYFEISAFFPLVLLQGTRLCNSVTTRRISKPSVHKGCPCPGWKHTGKKKKRWNYGEGQARVTGISCAWTLFPEPGRIFLLAFSFPALMKLRTRVSHIPKDTSQMDPIFILITYGGENTEGGSSCLIG